MEEIDFPSPITFPDPKQKKEVNMTNSTRSFFSSSQYSRKFVRDIACLFWPQCAESNFVFTKIKDSYNIEVREQPGTKRFFGGKTEAEVIGTCMKYMIERSKRVITVWNFFFSHDEWLSAKTFLKKLEAWQKENRPLN